MTTALIYDDRFLEHKTGRGHPERPDRLRAIMEGLKVSGLLDKLRRPGFDKADLEMIKRRKSRICQYCAHKRVVSAKGGGAFYTWNTAGGACRQSHDGDSLTCTEYPLFSRTGTHGLPTSSRRLRSCRGFRCALQALRPGERWINDTRARPGPADPVAAIAPGKS